MDSQSIEDLGAICELSKTHCRRALHLVRDAVPKPLGFIAFTPEWMVSEAADAAPPFRPLSRRSGRIPAFAVPSTQVRSV